MELDRMAANPSSVNEHEKQSTKTGKQRWSQDSYQLQLMYPYLSAAFLILFIIPITALLYFTQLVGFTITNIDNVYSQKNVFVYEKWTSSIIVTSVQSVFTYLMFPIAGWLADAKYGRLRVINASLWTMWFGLLIMILALLLATPGVIVDYKDSTIPSSLKVVIQILLFSSISIVSLGLAFYLPNTMPFLIDQLSEASSSRVSSYIRWYAWGIFIGRFVGYCIYYAYGVPNKTIPLVVVAIIAFSFHSIFLIINIFAKKLFIQYQGYNSPYKNLYGVLKFAWQHKAPLKRSAFTYGEISLPNRIDFAKMKYGGPYTHEHVENVKTFFRISIVFLSFIGFYVSYSGPFYEVDDFLGYYLDDDFSGWQLLIVSTDPLVPIIMIPLIEWVVLRVWPKFEYYLNKPFIWLLIGYVLLALSNASLSIISVVAYSLEDNTNPNSTCFLKWPSANANESNSHQILITVLVEIPSLFLGFSELMFFTSVLYFIGSQSPVETRGMLLGLYLLARGLFISLGTLLQFGFAEINQPITCGFWYWSALTAIAVISIPVYVVVAKNYRRRERQDIVDYRGIIEAVHEKDIVHNEVIDKHLQDLSEKWKNNINA